MSKTNKIKSKKHCAFLIHIHLVFVAKYRRTLLTQDHFKTTCEVFNKICDDFESELIEFDGKTDHMHLFVNYLPKIAALKLINSSKAASNRFLRQYYQDIHKYY